VLHSVPADDPEHGLDDLGTASGMGI